MKIKAIGGIVAQKKSLCLVETGGEQWAGVRDEALYALAGCPDSMTPPQVMTILDIPEDKHCEIAVSATSTMMAHAEAALLSPELVRCPVPGWMLGEKHIPVLRDGGLAFVDKALIAPLKAYEDIEFCEKPGADPLNTPLIVRRGLLPVAVLMPYRHPSVSKRLVAELEDMLEGLRVVQRRQPEPESEAEQVDMLKALPETTFLPGCLLYMNFDEMPASAIELDERYRELAAVLHPDAGGTDEDFIGLQEAYESARALFREREAV